MNEKIEFKAGKIQPSHVEAIVEKAAADIGLQVTLKDSLATYPGSVHWHMKQGRAPGILEVTYWQEEERLWFSVHRNRSAPWIEKAQRELAERLQHELERHRHTWDAEEGRG